MTGAAPSEERKPSENISLIASGESKSFVPSKKNALYIPYKLMGILLDLLKEENATRDPDLPKVAKVSFTFFEMLGLSWTYVTKAHGEDPKINSASDITQCVERCRVYYGNEFADRALKEMDLFIDNFQSEQRQNNLRCYIPTDPMNAHEYTESYTEILKEKTQNYEGMIALAEKFSGSSETLVKISAQLGMLGHFNHFRGGKDASHYSIHLLEVGERVVNTFDLIQGKSPALKDKQGNILDPKAVAVAVAFMHDNIEDFWENFMSDKRQRRTLSSDYTKADFRAVITNHMREVLSSEFGEDAAEAVLSYVKILSHLDDDEFPSTSFLKASAKDKITHVVRLCDIDHNLTTYPEYAPIWASIAIASQYLPFSEGTVFEENFRNAILRCLAGVAKDELLPWAEHAGSDAYEVVLNELKDHEGDEAIFHVEAHFKALKEALSTGEYDETIRHLHLLKEEVETTISTLLDAVDRVKRTNTKECASSSTLPSDLGLRSEIINDIPVRIVGPVAAWSGKIKLKYKPCQSRDDIEYTVMECAEETGVRVTGYITYEDGSHAYHMCRLPRRADLPVPSIDEYRNIFENLKGRFEKQKREFTATEQSHAFRPGVRAVFGFEEGYFEQRRKEILTKLEDGTISHQTAFELAKEQLGSKEGFVLTEREELSLKKFKRTLSRPLTIHHNIAEAQKFFSSDCILEKITIFAASPREDGQGVSIYQERGFVVTSSSPEAIPQFVAWADKTHQARFSLENLQGGKTMNIELLQFSENKAAQMT